MTKTSGSEGDGHTADPLAGRGFASRAASALRSLVAPSYAPRSPDRELVDGCLKGHEEAWAALIGKYQSLVYSVPIKYGAPREDAADIFQSVCLDLYNELPRLRSVESLRGWLMTVAAHKAYHWKRDRVRAQAREVEGVPEERLAELPLPPSLSQELEREQMVREGLNRLTERCRALIRMLFYEQPAWPYARVAQQLGLATGSIGFVRGRCLRQLQRVLEQIGF